MIKELQIRPFSRPLLVWIAGIILQTAFPLYAYSVLFLLFPLLVLVLSCFGAKERGAFCYETRWLWGAVFVSLLLFLSIQKTACSLVDLPFEHSESTLSRLAKEEQLRLLSILIWIG